MKIKIKFPLKETLNKDFYTCFYSNQFDISSFYKNSILELKNYYNTLEIDKYILAKENKKYRKRKYRKIIINNDLTFNITHDKIFYQDKKINSKYGGINRTFALISDYMLNNDFLKDIILFDYNIFNYEKTNNQKKWEVGVHLIRIISDNKNNIVSYPTPEGIHQDNFPFISQHFINSFNIKGGISTIYTLEKKEITSIQFRDFMDSCYVIDNKVMHGVSSITCIDKDKIGYRDMLILTYTPISIHLKE